MSAFDPTPGSRLRTPHARRGTILIIVAGIAAVLIALAASIMAINRGEAQDGALLVQDAQARLMLSAALCYIQETSRLGWGEESFGWTDLRNGTAGPRGPRVLRTGEIPAPPNWPGYVRDDSESGRTGASPHDRAPTPNAPGGAQWPAMGSVMRGDVFAMVRPPAALRETRLYNPIGFDAGKVDAWERAYDGRDTASARNTDIGRALNPTDAEVIAIEVDGRRLSANDAFNSDGTLSDKGLRQLSAKSWREVFAEHDRLAPGHFGLMNPQPVADTLPEYLAGDLRARSESTGRSWFRVYRESPTDHDGDGEPYFDTVPLVSHGVFVITCGAGATKGFRDWAEVQRQGAAAQFGGSQQLFDDLRANERILWFRAEWTGFSGGGADLRTAYGDGSSNFLTGVLTLNGGDRDGGSLRESGRQARTINASVSHFGCFRWIQRLERQPPVW